jgi:hypothetical protein
VNQIEKQPYAGRLACAIRTQEPEDFALTDPEIDIDHAPVLTVKLGQPRCDNQFGQSNRFFLEAPTRLYAGWN